MINIMLGDDFVKALNDEKFLLKRFNTDNVTCEIMCEVLNDVDKFNKEYKDFLTENNGSNKEI